MLRNQLFKKYMNTISVYLRYLAHEFLGPVNYLIAIGIGLLILTLQGSSPFASIVPYLVPIFVQAFSKSYVKFSSRHKEMLLSLPARRRDPVFLMNPDGSILLSSGKTHENFEERGIQSIGDLLDKEGKARVMHCLDEGSEECGPVECYSPPFNKWYKIKTGKSERGRIFLVWLEDITSRLQLNEKLSKIRDFSDDLIRDLSDLIEEDTSFSKLAGLMIDLGYEGVFIARIYDSGLEGLAYRQGKRPGYNEYIEPDISSDGIAGSIDMEISAPIKISKESNAPIWLSRRKERLSYDEVGAGGSFGNIYTQEEFRRAYHFDERVIQFIGSSIRNFINYHEGDISIIAFNLNRSIESEDLLAMEVIVNSARSVSTLLSLATENERKFLQSVTGLCAAAEYSDEITGMHILRVNEYSRLLAEKLGIEKKGQTHIGQVAAMHDIGKVAMPHLIKLNRAFTPEERREMEMHTIYGAQIIERMMNCCGQSEPRLAMAYEIALNHHQMWNGAGYPPIIDATGRRCTLSSKTRSEYDALRPAKGTEIPLTARIVSLADTYDALRSARQYKPGLSHEKTMDIIRLDDRSGLRGEDRFGADVLETFNLYQHTIAEIYADMRG
jgi:HD-GYP domain-containing protein (c-di-GMP phosphodiesterase class II)